MDLFFTFLCKVLLFHFGCAVVFSTFRQSDIFPEFLDENLIQSELGLTLITCSKACFRDSNCRRFKWCGDDVTSGQCNTYEDGQSCPHQDNGRHCYCFQKVLSYKEGVYTCPIGYYGERCEHVIKHCSEGHFYGLDSLGKKLSFIQPEGALRPFEVLCDFRYGGLTTIQSRNIHASPVDFNRTMDDYINGFGNPRYNHWLGLKRIRLLSKLAATKLNIELSDKDGYCQVYYDNSHIYGQVDNFKLSVSDFSMSLAKICGDSLLSADNVSGASFFTYDSDNVKGCAAKMGAGWWYAPTDTCTQGNLNAPLVDYDEAEADPAKRRIKWENECNDNVIEKSSIRLMRTDV